MLNERNFPAVDVRLLDDDESIGQLEATGDEINFIQSVRAEQFTKMDFTFFAADADALARTGSVPAMPAAQSLIFPAPWKRNLVPRSALSGWSASADRYGSRTCSRLHASWLIPRRYSCSAVAARASKTGAIRSAAATIFEPASEQGQRGMDELHQQTVNLLSFQTLPKDVFDTQVAFNMVARYGQNSKLSLDSLEQRVRRHYQKLAGTEAPLPALMVVQPPVFHGHGLAIF